MIALTDIKIGRGEDEEPLYIEAGQTVEGVDDETLEQLKAAGSVGEDNVLEKANADRDRIAELEAELARVTLERDQALRGNAIDPGQTGEAALRVHAQGDTELLDQITQESEQNTQPQGSSEDETE